MVCVAVISQGTLLREQVTIPTDRRYSDPLTREQIRVRVEENAISLNDRNSGGRNNG